jgi:hypothetical protein
LEDENTFKNQKNGWYFCRGVILTKDNLAKWNWHGSSRCVFYHHGETSKHLFFQYRFARSIWSAIQVAFSLYPRLVSPIFFGNWLHIINVRFRTLIRVGALAVIWSLWLFRNEKVLIDKNCSLLQVINRSMGMLHLWSSSADGESRPIYGDLYTIEGYIEGYFFPTWVAA